MLLQVLVDPELKIEDQLRQTFFIGSEPINMERKSRIKPKQFMTTARTHQNIETKVRQNVLYKWAWPVETNVWKLCQKAKVQLNIPNLRKYAAPTNVFSQTYNANRNIIYIEP